MGGEGYRPPEREPQIYYLASRFNTREESAVPYYAAQETIRTMGGELSAYRFMRQWEEESSKPWYVVVVGLKPSDEEHQRLTDALSPGEGTSVPDEVIEMLCKRHITEIATKGPWVEGHYKEGIQFTAIKFSRRSGRKGHRKRR